MQVPLTARETRAVTGLLLRFASWEQRKGGTLSPLGHPAATLILRAGVPVKDVVAMLGHSATVYADIYGHATPAGGKEAAQRVAVKTNLKTHCDS
ncbi:MAG TPA: hypothetical protein VMW83_11100 [Spirochaetia bacterium]|nr:hypothetical protein [Spirochaetia bacterium]